MFPWQNKEIFDFLLFICVDLGTFYAYLEIYQSVMMNAGNIRDFSCGECVVSHRWVSDSTYQQGG